MFTRMSKVVLWIAGIAVVIGGFIAGQQDGYLGLSIWLIGIVALWGIGVFVELVNNVMDIKIMISKGALNNIQPNNNSKEVTYQSTIDNSKKVEKPLLSNKGKDKVETKKIEYNASAWKCSQCKTINNSQVNSCTNCGCNTWSCPICGTTNHPQATWCVRCVKETRYFEINTDVVTAQTDENEIVNDNTTLGWFCRACGAKNEEQSVYCVECGKERIVQ